MFLIGMQLGHYLLTEWIGSGGMGDVYLAEDVQNKERVAVKVMKAELVLLAEEHAESLLKDFQKEARTIASLHHPGILKILAYGETTFQKIDLAYLAMPYCSAGNLLQWLQEGGRNKAVSAQVCGQLIEQAAEALQYAHDHQVVHRDVKPSNFLIEQALGEPERPYLLLSDFGIARLMNATSSVSQQIRGTPAYMAPEQWGGAATMASDQYALAVMAYEILTGRLPFQGNPMEMLHLHLHADPPLPSSLKSGLSWGVDEVLLCALRKRPEQRFAQIQDFARNLCKAISRQEYVVPVAQAEISRQAGAAGGASARVQPARGLSLVVGLLLFFLFGAFLLALVRGAVHPAGVFTNGSSEATSSVTTPDESPAAPVVPAFSPTSDQGNSGGETASTPPAAPTRVPTVTPTPTPQLCQFQFQ